MASTRHLFTVGAAIALSLLPVSAAGQATLETAELGGSRLSHPRPAPIEYVDLTEPDPLAARLTELRLAHQDERRVAGAVLMTGGLTSVIGGGIVAGALHEDPFWLAFGLGSAAWGLVNALLAVGMLDLGEGGYRAIEEGRALRGADLDAAREEARAAQQRSATIFALNLGLDFFYIATAALLFFVAQDFEGPDDAYLSGYAAAMGSQGAFLLIFDLVEWFASESRADGIAALREPGLAFD